METRRNLQDGSITVQAKNFVAVISEDGVRIQVGDAIVHEWKFETPASVADNSDRVDTPSPRSRPSRKRGAR